MSSDLTTIQAINGKDSPPPDQTQSSVEEANGTLAKGDTAQYHLVSGLDTNSETSLTDTSLLHDPAIPVEQNFSPNLSSSNKESQTKSDTSHSSMCSSSQQSSDSVSLDSDSKSGIPSVKGVVTEHTSVGEVGVAIVKDEGVIANSACINGKVTTTSTSDDSSPVSQKFLADQVPSSPTKSDTHSPDLRTVKAPQSDSHSQDSEIRLEDITLRSRSTSPEEYGPKVHPLSILTSDSELGETPSSPPHPYSPVPNMSGDEDTSSNEQSLSPSNHSPSSPIPDSDDSPVMSILFSGITYLGSSSVDAPISEIEANRKMHILKEQSTGTEPIPIVLAVPLTNRGSVVLKDPKTDQTMASYPIKFILFCARGNAEILLDCFCLNVKNKRSGMYQCHVFRCDIVDACGKVFQAIGKAFTTKINKSEPPLSGDNVRQDFLVSLDIHEEDGKGAFSPVSMDKDCFKLRLNTRKKVTLSVSQPDTFERTIIIIRCFGLLISPGKDVKVTEMNLLDNMNPSANPGSSFSVTGIWDTGVSFLAPLNEETSRSVRFQYLTVAADLILESVTEPVRFKREVKVHVSKGGMSTLLNQLSLTKKKQGPMDMQLFTLKLKKSEESSNNQSMYVVDELKPASELKVTQVPLEVTRVSDDTPPGRTPSPTQKTKRGGSLRGKGTTGGGAAPPPSKNPDDADESDNEDDDDMVVSGWGDVEGMREDLLKDWGDMLERWDGKDRARSSKLIKLCRKGIPRHLRCQVWQMLSGAAHDPQLAEAYRLLISKESPAENVINWDIKRTYVGHGYFQEPGNKEALYKISKAYSVYDEEVGYCQGFSFMAAVLLLQKMPEETAFSVLVKIMYNYGHRNIFKANFRDLHLMFYQLDRLFEEHLPDLFQHFQTNRIETHMYASQWFLTLYTAKFPLSIVFRILDIYLCERIAAIFQVALSLLKIARKELIVLDFEGILSYFRVALPKKFQSEEDCQHLFTAMGSFKINEKKLSKLQRDYQSFLEQQALLEDPVMRLERDNKQLRDTIHRLEQENDNLAQDLVGSKIKLRNEMDKLEERIDTLSKEARAHRSSHEASQIVIGELREELKQAKEEFQSVMMKLTEERQQHEGAITEYKQVFTRLDEGHQKQKEELSQELLEVKAKLGSGEDTNTPSSLSSEQRLRNLELELAQTKLALVESQCKNQELEHRVVELTSAKTRKWYDNVMDFGNKKK